MVPERFPHPTYHHWKLYASSSCCSPLLLTQGPHSLLSHDPEIFVILAAPPRPANSQPCKLPSKISTASDGSHSHHRPLAPASPSCPPVQPGHLQALPHRKGGSVAVTVHQTPLDVAFLTSSFPSSACLCSLSLPLPSLGVTMHTSSRHFPPATK